MYFQSIHFIGGLKPVSYQIAAIASSSYRHIIYCECHYNCAIIKSSEKTTFMARATNSSTLGEDSSHSIQSKLDIRHIKIVTF